MGVLRLRESRLLFFAQAISWLGDRMVGIALAFAVLSLGGSPAEVGLVLAFRLVPLVATLLVGGVVADRVSRRAVMVIADLVRVATQGAIAALLIAGAAEIWMLAVLSGLTGAATGFFNPASTGILPAIVPPERLQEANGVRATVLSGGEIAGPVLAGVLIATVGPGWALALDACTFAASAAFLARLRLPDRAVREAGSFMSDLREGWSVFRSLTWVWTFVLAAGIGNMLWGAWSALGPVVADRDLGGAAVWGTVLGALGIGALLGSVAAVRVRPRRPLVLAAATYALFVVPLLLLAARAPVPVLALGAMFGGVGMMLGNSVWESTLMRKVPDESLSRVSAYDWFGSLAFQPLGLVIWGPVAALIGLYPALWVAGGLLLVTNAVLLSVPAIRQLRA
ncbi:MFS transporter [Solirubrobacter ginsenosidimutans]|uniref:MFS transporter n=1 Tax=Solirubrobacter ginsenosidimutans TaxID=490573 RepID=A0A9X3MXF6_9ACTN|nr:MFS transporter [Solirubrobacter ginsenosidimutans]MDA0161243.1 MFS transporter [Solirubrobacter ginsenosidimutans]